MMFLFCVLWLSVAYGASPIAKVLVMLAKLKENCQHDARNEAALHEKYKQWCHKEEVQTAALIASTKQHITERVAFLQEQEALQTTYRADVAMIVQDISHTEARLGDANTQHDKEYTQFLAADKVFIDTISQLTTAIAELNKPIPVVRVTMLRQELQALLAHQQQQQQHTLHHFFTSLLGDHAAQSQRRAGGPDQVADAGRMRALVTLLKAIQRDAELERVGAQKAEARARAAHQLRAQALSHDVATLDERKSEKQRQLQLSREQCAVAGREKVASDKLVAETQRYVQDTLLQCEDKDRMYRERVASRGEEIEAIEHAQSILRSDDGRQAEKAETRGKLSFTSTVAQVVGALSRQRVSPVGAARDRIRGETVVTTFLQVRTHRRTPFEKVRKVIEGMIVKLLDEASGEAEQKQWCDKETSQTKRQHQHHAHIISKLTSRVKETDADYAVNAQNIQNARSELASLAQSFKEASEIRQKEHDAAVKVIQESDESQQVLQRAIDVLQAYYEKHDPAFLQQPPTPEGRYEGKQDAASGIIAILEISLADFARLESETKTEESTARREYEQYVQDCTMQRALTKVDIDTFSKEKAKMETLKLQIQQDLKAPGLLRAVFQARCHLK
eukprot:GEMP01015133.1.p1 GENE.GEMP01015133.1~~GEMP01015133.1.p1  ORF type:complete len:620 (+),score=199.30 GEMP01015133.1:276-2135(+)